MEVQNKEVFGNVAIGKEKTIAQIGYQDLKERETIMSTKEVEAQKRVVEKFGKWALFAIAISKHAWVVEIWEQLREGGHQGPCFSRQFNDWELESIEVVFIKVAKVIT